MKDFSEKVKPWCIENKYTLHEAFEYSRENDEEKYLILSQLWRTDFGKAYLNSVFSGYRGRVRR